jgi:chromosome segregation ATPase
MTSDDVAVSTQQLRGTVDAAKLLLQRGRSLTPRGGAHVRHSSAVDPVIAAHHHVTSEESVARVKVNAQTSSVLELNAALDEVSRLRRVLDTVGDVEQRVRDAVTQAVNKERHVHHEALEHQRSQTILQTRELKENHEKLQKTLQQRDKRIEALMLQVAAISSGGASAARLEKLEDQVTYLTAELLSRDALVDAKNLEITKLQERIDNLECAVGTSEATILALRDREGAMQRDIVRAQNDFRNQIESLGEAVRHRDASLAQAELLELGLHRELEDTKHQLRAALDLVQTTKDAGNQNIASLEEALRCHQLEAEQKSLTSFQRMSNTRLCALEALRRSASLSTHAMIFKKWRWCTDEMKHRRAALQSSFASTVVLLSTQAELAKHQMFVDCQQSLIDSFGARAHSLLVVLRHAEQQQSQLSHVVLRSESTATMQRQDLQSALHQARSDAIAYQQRSDTLTTEMHDIRERLRVSDIDRERFRTELDSEKRTLEAAKEASQQRLREMEMMYESRLADNSDSLRRERDVVERERASVTRLLSIQEASEKAMSELRLECARAQQEAAHLSSSLAHVNNSKEHADGLFTRSEAVWRSERDQLLEALDAQRAATRDALVQSVTRDTEERILRQRADDAERALRESEYQLKKSQHDLADALERLEATQQALRHQLDAMTALRSASSQQRRRRGSAHSTSQTPALSRTPHVQLIEPAELAEGLGTATPDRSATPAGPQDATSASQTPALQGPQTPVPVNPVLADSEHLAAGSSSVAPDAPAVDEELKELTSTLAAEAAAPPDGDPLEDGSFEPLGDDDHPDVVVLRASVDSLTKQLEFVQESCQKWCDRATRSERDVEDLRTQVVTLESFQQTILRLEGHIQQADAVHHELLGTLQQAQEHSSQLEREHVTLRNQLAASQKLEDNLHEAQQRATILQDELARSKNLEGEICTLAASNTRLEGERRLLEEQLTQCRAALLATEKEMNRVEAHSSSGDVALVLGLQERLAASQRDLLEEQAATARLQHQVDVSTRRTEQLEEELSEIVGMSGEMKSAYDALTASSPQPRSLRTTPPLPVACSHCTLLEEQIASLTTENEELTNELETIRRASRNPTTSSEDKAASHDLRVALDTAEVQVIKSHRALKRMEDSKALQECRMRDLAQELSALHADLAEERLLHETCSERHASLVRKLCQMLDLPFAELKDSEDLDRCILVAVDGLQAGQLLIGSDQEVPQTSRSASHTEIGVTLGVMTAAEVEQALQKLVYTHKREIRKLSDANAQLWAICHSSVDKTMISAALNLVADLNSKRVAARAWQQWRLWREQRKREQVVSSAQRTITRLQEQHGRLKEIAATAMNQVKELEQRKR